MDRIIGGIFGLAAFGAVLAGSISKGAPLAGTLLRASVALVLGYLAGRWMFGIPGLAIVKEAAGPVPPPAPALIETKPAGPAPVQAPGTRAQ